MADHAYAIVTTAEFKTWMGIDATNTDNDAIISLIVNQVTDSIETYCDRRIMARSGDITEIFDGKGYSEYYVLHPPIVSITSIAVEDAAAIDPTSDSEVRTDDAVGLIYLLQQTFATGYPQNCTVVYKGGYSTVPSDMVGKARKLAKMIYLLRDSNRELLKSTSNSITGETVNYLESILTPDIKAVLDKYVLRRYP